MDTNLRYVVFALLLAVLLLGVALGDFSETWQNGATL